eukprot:790003-Amphidinium_carterae.2
MICVLVEFTSKSLLASTISEQTAENRSRSEQVKSNRARAHTNTGGAWWVVVQSSPLSTMLVCPPMLTEVYPIEKRMGSAGAIHAALGHGLVAGQQRRGYGALAQEDHSLPVLPILMAQGCPNYQRSQGMYRCRPTLKSCESPLTRQVDMMSAIVLLLTSHMSCGTSELSKMIVPALLLLISLCPHQVDGFRTRYGLSAHKPTRSELEAKSVWLCDGHPLRWWSLQRRLLPLLCSRHTRLFHRSFALALKVSVIAPVKSCIGSSRLCRS